MNRLLRGLHERLQQLERLSATLILVGLLVTMVSQVVARYVFRAAFSWSEELCRFGLVWLTFLAAAYIMGQQQHIAVDLWSQGLRPRWRLWADRAVQGVVVFTCLLLFVGSLKFVWHVHPVGSPSLGIPKSLWYGGASLGLLLMAVHAGIQAYLGWQETEAHSPGEVASGPTVEGFQLHWEAEARAESTSGVAGESSADKATGSGSDADERAGA
jgi:TRAP-type C4-dicarboxylate transport system permease small subunit